MNSRLSACLRHGSWGLLLAASLTACSSCQGEPPLRGGYAEGLYPLPSAGAETQYIDATGKVVLDACPTDQQFRDGWVVRTNPPTYFDTSCKPVLTLDPQKFGEPSSFSEGLAVVKDIAKADKPAFGYIDKTGKWAIEPQFVRAGPFNGGLAWVEVAAEGGPRFVFVDKSGKRIAPSGKPGWERVRSFSEERAAVKAGGWTFIDPTGKQLGEPKWEAVGNFSEGLAAFDAGGKWGYVDRNLKVAIEPQFDAAGSFSSGWGLVRRSGRYGFVDRQGKMKGSFELARPFVSGRAAVRQGRWGFVDPKLELIVKPQYKDVRDFTGSLALVSGWNEESGEEFVAWIDKRGVAVWGPKAAPATAPLFDLIGAKGFHPSAFFGFRDADE
ncbi:MAG: WG repeat-containing protein [Polyangiaceae bacterium]